MTSCVFNTNEESYLKKDLTQSKIMNKKLLFVNQAEELGLIQQMAYTIRMSDLDIHPSKLVSYVSHLITQQSRHNFYLTFSPKMVKFIILSR